MKYLIISLLNFVFFNIILCSSICDTSNKVDFSESSDCIFSLSANISQNLKTEDDCLIRDAQGVCVSWKNEPPSLSPTSTSTSTSAATQTPLVSQAPILPKSDKASGSHFDNKWIIAIVAAIIIIGSVAFCIWKPRYAQENCHCMC